MNKDELRNEMRDTLAAFTPLDRATKSASIIAQLEKNPYYLSSKNIFVFVNTKLEPNTKPFIRHSILNNKNIYVPKCINNDIVACHISSVDDLAEGSFGILEPIEPLDIIEPEKLDLVIVPCLAINKKGDRIGHGLGYYDRYLKNVKATKLCLCFDCQVIDDNLCNDNDVPMDFVITEITNCE